MQSSHAAGPVAGHSRLRLLPAPPVVVLYGQDQVFATATVPAGLAAATQAQDVNLVPDAGVAGALDEIPARA